MISIVREARQCPPEIQLLVTRAGGWNPLGEPRFRVVWGWSRLTKIAGEFVDYDSEGCAYRTVVERRLVPKYPENLDRWIVEAWVEPWMFGSRVDWEIQATEVINGERILLAPYPSKGDYEHCFTLQTPAGEYLALSAANVTKVIQAVHRSRQLIGMDSKGRRGPEASRNLELLREKKLKAEKEVRDRDDACMDDRWPAFGGRPMVTVL